MRSLLLFSHKLRGQLRDAEARRAETLCLDSGDVCSLHQLTALQRIWRDAVFDVPYYASLVDSGQAPKHITSWSDVQAIPVLTRQHVQNEPQAFVRRSAPPRLFTTTAGSTGTPLRIGAIQSERDIMRVVKLSSWMEFGYTPASRLFLIWGHSHLLGTGLRGRIRHIERLAIDSLLGYHRANAYRLNPKICVAYADRIVRIRPLGIVGYASALDLLARYTAQYRERFRAIGVRFVLATAEPMPNPDTIEILEDLFGCPVVQEYGGAEFGQVAFKSGAGPFRVYSDLNLLECENAESSSTAHSALLTALYPRYVPLVRYRIGDALLSPVRLDHGHVPAFSAVGGRMNDVIRLGDGDSVHSVSVFHCIHQEPGVHNIQMALSNDAIAIRLVADVVDKAALEGRLRARLRQVHPLLANARFEYVEDVETNRAGKRRWFVDHRDSSRVQ